MKKLMKLGTFFCTVMLAFILASFTEKPQEEPNLEGTWVEVFYEFNFDAGRVETKNYSFTAMLSNQEVWYFKALGGNKYNVTMTYFARNSGGFITDGDWDIDVVDNMFVTEFTDNFKIKELTEDKLVVECYNGDTLKERKTFKKKN